MAGERHHGWLGFRNDLEDSVVFEHRFQQWESLSWRDLRDLRVAPEIKPVAGAMRHGNIGGLARCERNRNPGNVAHHRIGAIAFD